MNPEDMANARLLWGELYFEHLPDQALSMWFQQEMSTSLLKNWRRGAEMLIVVVDLSIDVRLKMQRTIADCLANEDGYFRNLIFCHKLSKTKAMERIQLMKLIRDQFDMFSKELEGSFLVIDLEEFLLRYHRDELWHGKLN